MANEPRIIFKLTQSQRLAVLSILAEHWQCDGDITEQFPDMNKRPIGIIQYGDLLKLFASTPEYEEPLGDGEGAA